MFEIICICVTVIICVWIISNAHWKITLNSHAHTETPQPNITEEQLKAGITHQLVRLSVGIEDSKDLIADLAQSLDELD